MEIFVQYPLECLYIGLILELTWLFTWKPNPVYILGFPTIHCLLGWGIWLYASAAANSGEKDLSAWTWVVWGGALVFYLQRIFLLPSDPQSSSRRLRILQRRRNRK